MTAVVRAPVHTRLGSSRWFGFGSQLTAWVLVGTGVVAYLSEAKGIAMRRSRIGEVLQREGLRWRQEETWFGARVDPDFARKRGRLSSSTPPRPQAAPSFASTPPILPRPEPQ